MTTRFRRVVRGGYAALALALASAGLLPMLYSHAFAYGQVTSRSIKMSSSVVNAASQNYLVTFTPASASTIHGIAVDFCASDPLPGDACTLPTSFSVGTPTVTGVTVTGQSSCSFTATAANSSRTLLLDDSACTGTPTGVSFTLTTAHNPNTLGTFYARIFTFPASGNAATWAAANSGDGSSTTLVTDAGGIALSTTTNITILARVMERLTFCTSNATLAATDCSGATTPVSLTIGHVTGGGSTKAIDDSVVDAASAYTQLSTNATNGAIVRMKNVYSTICGGLSRDNGTSCEIGAIGASPALFPSTPSATADFGMCVIPDAGLQAFSPYDGSSPGTTACTDTLTPASTASYGLGDTTATTTYGDQIFRTWNGTSSGPVSKKNAILNFAAIAATTTPSGIYQTAESLVATGTF